MVSLAVIAGTGNNFFCVICFIDWCVREGVSRCDRRICLESGGSSFSSTCDVCDEVYLCAVALPTLCFSLLLKSDGVEARLSTLLPIFTSEPSTVSLSA